jgi:hypothetical protein
MKRTIGVILGLLLLAASAAWFLSDLPGTVHETLATRGIVEEPRTMVAEYRARGATPGGSAKSSGSSWETIKAGLDVANALIGIIGIYLTLRVLRAPRPS